ncbi:MAG TPA: nucleoside 2-deoxyribosyltransferase domain-containing protein [Herpetosiphonaceae bacterium]|nr:nucleoside 2-deoxyribosyltransferase domain-containing protein [Herpetosiphonaceae bacterium]
MGGLFLPPERPAISGPLIFLAGPIQGAPPWQDEAARLLLAAAPDLWVASPRRPRRDDFSYAEQVDWETWHLRRAAEAGVIVFWLAREVEHSCERAYAQTTRFELAEWKLRHERDGARLAVGIEAGFSGERYIRRRLGQDCPGIPICASLEATCQAAIGLIAG